MALMDTTAFQLEKKGDKSRTGSLRTRRGTLSTPFFMPDATRASVRGLTNEQLVNAGVHPMVVNTYHLLLQPGTDLLDEVGGIHSFMNWDGPLLSDSGGYQVYSLIHKNASLGRITEDGAEFRSVIDGSLHVLTPERAIQIQFSIGTDMMVVLDDPRPTDASREEHQKAVERTIRWAGQCKEEFQKQAQRRELTEETRPLLFAVVQGGPYSDLREQCAKALIEIGFDGYGFGGRHIDQDGVFMDEVVAHTAKCLPLGKPRFALGIGTPEDIVRCWHLGWDLFDCVIPTREGRHGRIFIFDKNSNDKLQMINDKQITDHRSQISTSDFYRTFNISNEKFKKDLSPIDPQCDCYACQNYTRAYLKHLFRVGEPLGGQMIALHNIRFYTVLMEELSNVGDHSDA